MRIDQDRSPINEAWIARYNEMQVNVARRNPTRATVFDFNRLLDPDGTWTDTVDGVKVRSFDRSHLSEEGADFAAAWLVPLLAHRHEKSVTTVTPTGVASAGPRRERPSLPPQPAFVAQRS